MNIIHDDRDMMKLLVPIMINRGLARDRLTGSHSAHYIRSCNTDCQFNFNANKFETPPPCTALSSHPLAFRDYARFDHVNLKRGYTARYI